ncbi:MAG: hypothetical protein ABIG03_03520 [Candidatus Eisenbacteria bacterium]
MTNRAPAIVAACMLAFLPSAVLADAIIADHTAPAQFDALPDTFVSAAQSQFKMFYGHTSHGSQIVTGMEMVRVEDPLFDYNNGQGSLLFEEYGSDLGHNGDLSWAAVTRARLDQAGNDVNLVMWSWCGGCSDNTEEGIDAYLNEMDLLESEYPAVSFVYMTGHLDGTGPAGNLYARNNQIRDYCVANDKVLFDFADIESYDPAGTWYPDETDACGWCAAWCASHTCPGCASCAHSHCFNCYRKGRAFWWMLGAVVSGMEAGLDGPEVAVPALSQNTPNPFSPATEIAFTLPVRTRAVVAVHTLDGRRVAVLLDDVLGPGDYTASWDGLCGGGRRAAAGVYFCSLRTDDSLESKKMLLIR